MIIYKVTNIINGNCYIGKTVQSLEIRKSCHFSDLKRNEYTSYFHNALRKYGSENFEWDIIHRTNNEDHLNELEKFYIKFYRAKVKVYNRTDGGDGISGYKFSDDIKNKISNSLKGFKHTEETRKKLSYIQKIFQNKPEVKERTRKNSTGRKHTEETKLIMSNKAKGRHHTEETKLKMKKSWETRSPISEETRKKQSIKWKREKNPKWNHNLDMNELKVLFDNGNSNKNELSKIFNVSLSTIYRRIIMIKNSVDLNI
jgi:group I intron endonuclease